MDTLELIDVRLNEDTDTDLRIIQCQYDGSYLQVFLSDGRIIFLPENWLPKTISSTMDLFSEFNISPDGDFVSWPEKQAVLSLNKILSGAEPCEGCWFRVAFYQ